MKKSDGYKMQKRLKIIAKTEYSVGQKNVCLNVCVCVFMCCLSNEIENDIELQRQKTSANYIN